MINGSRRESDPRLAGTINRLDSEQEKAAQRIALSDLMSGGEESRGTSGALD